MLTENKLGKLSVLLAEDNATNALFISTIIGNWGFSLMVAINGNEVVKLVEQNDFDLNWFCFVYRHILKHYSEET